MDTETRLNMMEGRIENLRTALAASERRVHALESGLLYFISLADRVAKGPAEATVNYLESHASDLRRKKDPENAQELAALATLLGQMIGVRSV